jgi:geranylgeranyl reductase family protein
MQEYEVIIAGAGPSGSAAALQLTNLDPDLADKVLLLDKAVFPRPKLCAGGVTRGAELILEQLGIEIGLPSIPVHVSKFVFPSGYLTVQQASHFRVFRRSEFDHYLFRTAQERGIVAHDGEAVERLTFLSDGIVIHTSKDDYRAKILIGADGANSTIRRLLSLRRNGRAMMAIEIHVPVNQMSLPEFEENMAIFDYTQTGYGIPGYCWIFPATQQAVPMLSLGIIEAPFERKKRISLKSAFTHWLTERGLDLNNFNVQAHPALRYEPRSPCCQYRILLVGDAAGVDPLFGEGITSALALGMIAAQSAFDAIRTKDFSFFDYEKHIRSSSIGNMMRRRRTFARRLYSGHIGQHQYSKIEDLFNWVIPLDPKETPATITWEPSLFPVT